MPRRPQFYDPEIQTVAPAVEERSIEGIYVPRPGVWVHVDDVADALRRMAEETDGDARDALVGAAESFSGSEIDSQVAETSAEPERVAEPLLDDHPEVARIEVFPDEVGKWYARPVASDGSILLVTDGSFDRSFVETDAQARWSGKEIHELPDAMGDSIWDEQHHAFGFNGRRRPSPRRLWQ